MRERQEMDSLKDLLSKIYKNEENDKWLMSASDKEIKAVAANMESGVHVASPVFAGER